MGTIRAVKKVVIGFAAFALAASAAGGAAHDAADAAAKPRANVIVIETDDQTVEQMRVMTKTLGLVGAQGVTFDNSFVGNSLCCPSRATFLTGQYSHNNGVFTNSLPYGGYQKLNHSNTLAVWLQKAGYTTTLVGKYLNGYGAAGRQLEIPPGWTEWFGGVNLAFFNWTMNQNGVLVRYGSSPVDYQSDVITTKAVDVIRRRAPEANPLFMWVTYHAPHSGGPREPGDPAGMATVNVGPRYKDRFANESLPSAPSFNEADVSDKPSFIRNRRLLNQQRIAALRQAYQQQLESLLSVDDGVAAIVEALRASGELDNTYVIFTDDNGFFHGEHRVPNGKVLVYEPSIRVPLLVRGPAVPKNRHLRQLVSNVDLAPTIVAIAKAKAERVMDGKSLLPLFRNRSTQWGRDLFVERGPGREHFTAIRTPRYKYVEYDTGEKELYDVANDPDELNNLAGVAGHAAIQAELAQRLAKLRGCSGASCRVGPRVELKRFADCRVHVVGADRRFVSSVRMSRKGRNVTARISFTDGRIVLRAATLARGC